MDLVAENIKSWQWEAKTGKEESHCQFRWQAWKTLNMDETSAESDENGPEFPSMGNGDQKMQAEKEIEELDMVGKEINHLMGFIIRTLPKQPIKSSEEQAIHQEILKEDRIIERFPTLISS